MGVTDESVVAWSCTEVGGTTYVAGASNIVGTRFVSSCGVLEVCSKPNDGKKTKYVIGLSQTTKTFLSGHSKTHICRCQTIDEVI